MTRTRKTRYFYGWNIVAASFLAGLSYAEHFSSILGFFIKPLQGEFGWSRSAIAGVQSISRVVEAIFAPIVGPLVDRYGPRVLMPIGSIIVGMAMLGVTRINSIWQFYILRGFIVAIGFTLMGYLVTDVTINKWFIQKRGRAIAFGRSGGNVSNIIMVPLSVFIIGAYGWRMMFVIFAAITFLFVLIPSAIFMRRRPEDMGYHPDGMDPSTVEKEEKQQEHPNEEKTSTLEPLWSRRDVLMTRTFWVLVVSFAVNSLSFQGINISIVPYIQDLGYRDTLLAAVVTFRSVVMIAASLIMGFLAERAHRTVIRVAPFIIQALGVSFLLFAGNAVFLWPGVALYGLGTSGVYIIQEVLWANYFGRLNLGLVRSTGYFISFGFGAVGPVAMNAVFDIFGSYQPAFLAVISLCFATALLLATARPVKAKRYGTIQAG